MMPSPFQNVPHYFHVPDRKPLFALSPLGTGYRPNFRMRPPPPADPPAGDIPSRGGSAWRKASSQTDSVSPSVPTSNVTSRPPGLPWQMTLHPSCARRRLLNPQAPPPDAAARAEAAGRHQTDGACLAGRHRRGSSGGGRGELAVSPVPCISHANALPPSHHRDINRVGLASHPWPLAHFPNVHVHFLKRRTHAADHIRLTRNVGRW
ncbi:hypothetical protein B0T11DRAFT_93284 [Plectosphaerella cucumerina]|uniref:Uncharacterized protein n=1 Tax=Plectosphaerella cucumerina TaxID=40658 RepID=A0A8K0X4N1_9PEZI|nr:hypothetical protein B0T11DRAFT_93284 [Plectosphaerella cucumerina]